MKEKYGVYLNGKMIILLNPVLVQRQGITDEQLEAIIGAAQRASSSSNLQPWSVIIIRDVDRKRRLADALGLVVAIAGRGEAGEIRIRYSRLEQLDEICRRLGVD